MKPHDNIVSTFLFKFWYELNTRWGLIYGGNTGCGHIIKLNRV